MVISYNINKDSIMEVSIIREVLDTIEEMNLTKEEMSKEEVCRITIRKLNEEIEVLKMKMTEEFILDKINKLIKEGLLYETDGNLKKL